jgi:thioredoxin-dependent peroxiredoxin
MTTLKIGDKAPTFESTNDKGEKITSESFPGKKIVLYFYPKDDTPGCTAQACSLRDSYTELRTNGFEILGVSPDEGKKHTKFINKYSLPFELLADTDQSVANAYGVWGEKKFMGKTYDGIHRTTFVIGEDGLIEKIFDKVKTDAHAEQILESYK